MMGGGVLALVAARNEERTVAATVKALFAIAGVDDVVVVVDGSIDRTAEEAWGAGARVLLRRTAAGKGEAIEGALDRLWSVDAYLLVDADTADSAREAEPLVEPVRTGQLDVAIGRLAVQSGGGFGTIKRATGWTIRRITGFDAAEPLSGQRCVRAETLHACRPLARGFGLETAMTIDAVRLGFRVGEIDVAMTHRPTGRTLSGFAHRARQGAHIARAVLPRAVGLR